MISIGGADPTIDSLIQDPFTFDMVTRVWMSGCDSNTEAYLSSNQVKQYYSQKY
jgi:hypothetical protein